MAKNIFRCFEIEKGVKMSVNFNSYKLPVSFSGQNDAAQRTSKKNQPPKQEPDISSCLKGLTYSSKATIPPFNAMKGINPNSKNVFDTFSRIDDVTRSINFVKSQDAWNDCLMEEIQEFNVARAEYQMNPNKQNYEHMEEEMGDIFYTAASIAKDSGIDPEEAFKSTNRKFFNRINLMERILNDKNTSKPKSLKDCRDYERRALWNAAKRKMYDAQAQQYQFDANA